MHQIVSELFAIGEVVQAPHFS